MNIKPSAQIRQNNNEIADLCRSIKQPVYLTKNDERDLVVMDIESFGREQMLKLREELLAVEEDRAAGRRGCSPDELETYLTGIIDKVENGQREAAL